LESSFPLKEIYAKRNDFPFPKISQANASDEHKDTDHIL
jgi:hypothetical protein